LNFGIASRPMPGLTANGDTYLIRELNEQILLAVIDGLGHGEEASSVSEEAKEYIAENSAKNIEQIIAGLHLRLHGTRGVVAGLIRIDRLGRRLSFCGVGNIDARIIGEPPMHPTSLDGIIGLNVRKIKQFAYDYASLRAVVLYSDGISSKFSTSDYPTLYKQPQEVADQILAEWGKQHDDATILIGIEETAAENHNVTEIIISSEASAMVAAERVKELAKTLGFSECDQTKISIATSELAQNIAFYAHKRGRIAISSIKEPARVGIIIMAEDQGPGIPDVKKALQGIDSSEKGLGIGLGGAQRLMDEFSIKSELGKGTTIIAKKWKSNSSSREETNCL
jgi:negative regulator of sigma-B (phosphoserine phosphatase)